MDGDYPQLILADRDPDFYRIAAEYLADVEGVQVTRCHFNEVEIYDCLIMPGNSFGLIAEDSLQAEIFAYFEADLDKRIQSRILAEFLGEQLVGTCILAETGHPLHRMVAHVPIMRVTMPVAYTDNIYQASWAALLAVHHHNQQSGVAAIRSVLFPNLGIKNTALPPAQAARQIALAIRNYRMPPKNLNWHFANNRQQEVRYGGDDGFGFPPEWA